MTLPDKNRSLIRAATVPQAPGTKVNVYHFSQPVSLATMLADGYFNFANGYLQVGDVIHLLGGATAAAREMATCTVTAVPSSGDVTVATDTDETPLARAVTATADGLTTGLLAASDSFVSVTSAAGTDKITAPDIATVSLGKEIWGKIGATACVANTPSASTTKINGADAHSSSVAVAASSTFMLKKVAADEWSLVTFAPTAGAAMPAPA